MRACTNIYFALTLAACGGQFTSDTSVAGGPAGGGGSISGGSGGATGGSAGTGGASGGSGGSGGNVGGSTSTGGAAGTGGVSGGKGGGSGTGGAVASGGAAGTGGGAGAGGVAVDGGACVNSTVTFQLKAPGGGSWCLGQGCSTEWLQIRDAAGSSMILSNSCQSTCEACQMLGCPAICVLPQKMPAAGTTKTWDGTSFSIGTCGPNAMSCLNKQCAPAGKYVAVMCATASTAPDASLACSSSTTVKQTCVEVPFEYPSSAPVVGALP
jgi:hypothetical protein